MHVPNREGGQGWAAGAPVLETSRVVNSLGGFESPL